MLRIGTTGTETPFLAEGELPECARLTGSPEEEAKALNDSARLAEEVDLQEAIRKSRMEVDIQQPCASTSGSVNKTDFPAMDPRTDIMPKDNFTEKEVNELSKLGFTRENILTELRHFDGDKTKAMAALFAKSLKF